MIDDEQKIRIMNTFNSIAPGYDRDALRFFTNNARLLPDYCDLVGTEHVLDVAAGTGHAAMELARRLPKGRVTGIDFSDAMLSVARDKAKTLGLSNVELIQMDMQALDFADRAFDLAVSAFGIFFVEDMVTQLRHITSKVRPGGRVVITSFYKTTFRPFVGLFFERVKAYGVEVPQVTFRISSPDECRALFESAGLVDISVERASVGYDLTSAEQWWEVVWNAGFRRYLSTLSPDEVERFRREHLAEVSALDGSMRLEVDVLYTRGVRRD